MPTTVSPFAPDKNRDTRVSGLLLVLCLGLVCWIRLLPLSLPVADSWAEEIVRRRVGERLAQEREPTPPTSHRQDAIQQRVDEWIAQNR